MTGFSGPPIVDEPDVDSGSRWAGVARVVGPAWTRLPSLTIGLFGIQVLWSVEMSYASPYLLSLGLSKSFMAIVFLAGPLSGLIVQPLIGILADNSKSRFGRRRPFIMVSAALCALSTLLLGFTRPFATIFTPLNTISNDVLTIWLAILSIYCIDFSINGVQALDRALLVDTLPTSKQPVGNAWAARMQTIGSVAGFFIGNIDLPHIFPFLGNVQLEPLTVLGALLLCLTQGWMCFHVKERVLISSASGPKGFRQEMKGLWITLVNLPNVIRQICWIQFFASLAWFPLMFYTTVYIGDLHKRSSPIPETEAAEIALDDEATRLGTRALFYSALVSLAANIILPYFVSHHVGHTSNTLPLKHKTWFERVRIHLASLWALSHLIFALCMAATFVTSTVSGATWIMSITGFCSAISLWAPFALLGEAILSHPVPGGAGSIHLVDTRSTRVCPRDDVERGTGEEEMQHLFQVGDDEDDAEEEYGEGIVLDDHSHPQRQYHRHGQGHTPSRGPRPPSHDHIDDLGSRITTSPRPSKSVSPPLSPPPSPSRPLPSLPSPRSSLVGPRPESLTDRPSSSTGRARAQGLSSQAGAIIGIFNMFVVMPQFLVTGLASLIFAWMDPNKSVLHAHGSATSNDGTVRAIMVRADEGSGQRTDSIVVLFQLGSIASAVAFILAYRLAKQLQRH